MSTRVIAPALPVAPAARRWTAHALTALPILFLVVDGAAKLAAPAPVRDAMAQLGFAQSLAAPIGVLLLACVALFLVPRTRLLGALLLTAYLGGAVAVQLRAGNPLFSNVLFPVYFALMLWGGEYLRDPRVRALFAHPL